MINPVLFNIGPLEVKWYGVFYLISFIALYFYLDYLRKKDVLKLSKDQVYDLILYLIVGIVLGARLFHAFVWHPDFYLVNPLDLFKLWDGGMAFHGGLIGAIIAGLIFSKKHNYKVLKLADILVVPAALILSFGRLVNWINQEIWGVVYNGSFCVKDLNDLCRFPYQAAAAIKRFFIFLILVQSSKKQHKDGFIFWLFILLSGISRFLLDFYKEDARVFLSLSTGQITSFVMFVLASYVLLKYYKKTGKNEVSS